VSALSLVADVVVTIEPPGGVPFTRSLVAGEVTPDGGRAGRFYYLLDTSSAAGTWRYQFADPDAGTGVVQRKAITVTRRLAPA
jgi:hypothetical protein